MYGVSNAGNARYVWAPSDASAIRYYCSAELVTTDNRDLSSWCPMYYARMASIGPVLECLLNSALGAPVGRTVFTVAVLGNFSIRCHGLGVNPSLAAS